ncbi:hypothetical protein K402DRAFT_423784 [Aulographum hederae CBS 113979]|uniref:Uncharacterized protein n=1 Tax=Aulographum hederae CBS 113979 TaxID=1176131 RepID=A0A6G1GRQ4_9PEZI|nr:hypothetical protein K402DRAFT_423784 [Aulographum hederae CBS 113979]
MPRKHKKWEEPSWAIPKSQRPQESGSKKKSSKKKDGRYGEPSTAHAASGGTSRPSQVSRIASAIPAFFRQQPSSSSNTSRPRAATTHQQPPPALPLRPAAPPHSITAPPAVIAGSHRFIPQGATEPYTGTRIPNTKIPLTNSLYIMTRPPIALHTPDVRLPSLNANLTPPLTKPLIILDTHSQRWPMHLILSNPTSQTAQRIESLHVLVVAAIAATRRRKPELECEDHIRDAAEATDFWEVSRGPRGDIMRAERGREDVVYWLAVMDRLLERPPERRWRVLGVGAASEEGGEGEGVFLLKPVEGFEEPNAAGWVAFPPWYRGT